MSKAIPQNELERSKNLIFFAEFIRDCANDDVNVLKEILSKKENPESAKNINDIIEGRMKKYQSLIGVEAVPVQSIAATA